MTHLVKRAPPSIPQQLRGIIEAKRSQSLYNESYDRSASMMPRTYGGIKSGARFTKCVIIGFRESLIGVSESFIGVRKSFIGVRESFTVIRE
jgi:hypothetical protein